MSRRPAGRGRPGHVRAAGGPAGPAWLRSAVPPLGGRGPGRCAADDVDVVVADHNMPGTTGISLCDELTANRPELPVVVITAFGSLETAIAAIRAGAYDFFTKPFEIEELTLTLERALAHRR